MSNSSLLKQCTLFYKQLQQQIEGGVNVTCDEMKWIERAFGIAMQTWFNVEKIVNAYQFTDENEEIRFYKSLEPQFMGLLEYFTLLYKSVLFQPDDNMGRDEYWRKELKNCREFIATCKTGCRYYEEGDIRLWQRNRQKPLVFGVNINHCNIKATSYSYLRGKIIALKKYTQYINEKKL